MLKLNDVSSNIVFWTLNKKPRSIEINLFHYVKSARIQSFSGPYFPVFGLYTERFFGKMRTRKTPNTDTFHTVFSSEWIWTNELSINFNPFHTIVKLSLFFAWKHFFNQNTLHLARLILCIVYIFTDQC